MLPRHIAQAVNLPQADLATRLAEVPRDCMVDMVCWSGYRARRAAQFLMQMGYERVTNLRGGTEAWIAEGRPVVAEQSASGHRVAETEWMHASGSRS